MYGLGNGHANVYGADHVAGQKSEHETVARGMGIVQVLSIALRLGLSMGIGMWLMFII